MERQTKQTAEGMRRAHTVRDSFTMPSGDHRLIRELQLTYARAGILFNKGEVLRAGLHALKGMTLDELSGVAQSIEHLKSGRRRK